MTTTPRFATPTSAQRAGTVVSTPAGTRLPNSDPTAQPLHFINPIAAAYSVENPLNIVECNQSLGSAGVLSGNMAESCCETQSPARLSP